MNNITPQASQVPQPPQTPLTPQTPQSPLTPQPKKCYKLWHLILVFLIGVIIAVLLLISTGGGFLKGSLNLGDFGGGQGTSTDAGSNTEADRGTFGSFTEEFVPTFQDLTPQVTE
jgi:hypothetical protein